MVKIWSVDFYKNLTLALLKVENLKKYFYYRLHKPYCKRKFFLILINTIQLENEFGLTWNY